MSLKYLNEFPIENISLNALLVIGFMIFKFFLLLLDNERIHSFLLGFFQYAIQSQVLMNPDDSKSKQLDETKKGEFSSSNKKQKREADQILHRGDVEIVLKSLGLTSHPEEARLDLESHEIFDLFEEKNPTSGEVKEAFDVFDCDRDGFIDSKDLQKVLCSLGLDSGLEMGSCRRMIDVFDENGDGRLDFDEFVKFLKSSL